MNTDEQTHFGYKKVPLEEKARHVAQVFSSVAPHYDLMNDLMSLGIHRLWKRFTIELSGVKMGECVLDLAGGTGDLAVKFFSLVGTQGKVILGDINADMLHVGRERLLNQGVLIDYVQLNAEMLPFADNSFDIVTIAFGLRNVTNKGAALSSILRILKPGGRLLILEFSEFQVGLLKPFYDLYSFKVLPFLGKLIARDADSYRYLAESIRVHPNQEALLQMLKTAGFERCNYFNLSGGVVAVHRGYKL